MKELVDKIWNMPASSLVIYALLVISAMVLVIAVFRAIAVYRFKKYTRKMDEDFKNGTGFFDWRK